MKKKKILHISKFYYPTVGGIEEIAYNCVNALRDRFEQKVICFNEENESVIECIEGVEIYRYNCIGCIASQSISLSIIGGIKRMFKEWQPDYILLHYPNPYVSHFVLHNMIRGKLIVYWHSDIIKQKMLKLFFVRQNKVLIRKAYKIIATSPNYIDGSTWLKLAGDKCVVIPNCINDRKLLIPDKISEKISQIRSENENKIICISVGRHVEYKGFELLIKASKELDNRFIFYIAGQGPLTDKLKMLAKDDGKIQFLGKINNELLCSYLAAADIFCFPSITKNEAFGVALAEGMYYGKPSVTFNIVGSGVNYVSVNRLTGIECENQNYIEYAEALRVLADNELLRKEYGMQAYKRVQNLFLLEQYYENIQGLFS